MELKWNLWNFQCSKSIRRGLITVEILFENQFDLKKHYFDYLKEKASKHERQLNETNIGCNYIR